MAENIGKLYKRVNKKEGQETGQWYGDSPKRRYERVMNVLRHYYLPEDDIEKYDIHDVKWFVKNAIINKIYISDNVKSEWENDAAWKNARGRKKEIWNALRDNNYAVDGYLYMDIRKHSGKYYFEHVVPAKVYLKRLLTTYESYKDKGQVMPFEEYERFRQNINIAVITTEENRRLDKKMRCDMPDGVDFMDGDQFSRYTQAGIELPGLDKRQKDTPQDPKENQGTGS